MCCVVGEVFSCVECNFISWGFTIDHGVTITGTLPPEVTGSYIIAGQQVATRRVDGLGAGVLYWLVGDHPSASLRIGLRSTTLVLDQNGAKVDEIRYYPYGAERWPLDRTFPTDYRFTGQKYEAGVGGLYQMGARWYAGWPYDPTNDNFLFVTLPSYNPISFGQDMEGNENWYFVNHGMQGFSDQYHFQGRENTHHWAGHLITAYHGGRGKNMLIVRLREALQKDMDKDADISMGDVAGMHAYALRRGYVTIAGFAAYVLETMRAR
jgi:hypothetical protein